MDEPYRLQHSTASQAPWQDYGMSVVLSCASHTHTLALCLCFFFYPYLVTICLFSVISLPVLNCSRVLSLVSALADPRISLSLEQQQALQQSAQDTRDRFANRAAHSNSSNSADTQPDNSAEDAAFWQLVSGETQLLSVQTLK